MGSLLTKFYLGGVYMTLELFLQHLANGISLGSLYALVAIGYTMVYGILRLINFAHGDIFMMAVYFAFFGVVTFSIPCRLHKDSVFLKDTSPNVYWRKKQIQTVQQWR
jgi:hypothetical protein